MQRFINYKVLKINNFMLKLFIQQFFNRGTLIIVHNFFYCVSCDKIPEIRIFIFYFYDYFIFGSFIYLITFTHFFSCLFQKSATIISLFNCYLTLKLFYWWDIKFFWRKIQLILEENFCFFGRDTSKLFAD